jgi:phosphatidylglycerophosphatase GEP4
LKKSYNINYIVFDKDNTLTIPHHNKLANEEIEQHINKFRKVFGKNNIVILSNSAGSRDDKDYREAEEIEKVTGLKVLRHENKKPNVYKEIKGAFGNVKSNNFKTYPPEENKKICIVGDRLLVDVLMGYEFKFFTILVNPITTKKENFIPSQHSLLERTTPCTQICWMRMVNPSPFLHLVWILTFRPKRS